MAIVGSPLPCFQDGTPGKAPLPNISHSSRQRNGLTDMLVDYSTSLRKQNSTRNQAQDRLRPPVETAIHHGRIHECIANIRGRHETPGSKVVFTTWHKASCGTTGQTYETVCLPTHCMALRPYYSFPNLTLLRHEEEAVLDSTLVRGLEYHLWEVRCLVRPVHTDDCPRGPTEDQYHLRIQREGPVYTLTLCHLGDQTRTWKTWIPSCA